VPAESDRALLLAGCAFHGQTTLTATERRAAWGLRVAGADDVSVAGVAERF